MENIVKSLFYDYIFASRLTERVFLESRQKRISVKIAESAGSVVNDAVADYRLIEYADIRYSVFDKFRRKEQIRIVRYGRVADYYYGICVVCAFYVKIYKERNCMISNRA